MPPNHFILCRPLLLLPSIFPSIRVFSNESVLHIRWPKDWSFSFSISPSHEYSGLISFRMDWLDLLAVQGTLKSPLQHHSSKASIQEIKTLKLCPPRRNLQGEGHEGDTEKLARHGTRSAEEHRRTPLKYLLIFGWDGSSVPWAGFSLAGASSGYSRGTVPELLIALASSVARARFRGARGLTHFGPRA